MATIDQRNRFDSTHVLCFALARLLYLMLSSNSMPQWRLAFVIQSIYDQSNRCDLRQQILDSICLALHAQPKAFELRFNTRSCHHDINPSSHTRLAATCKAVNPRLSAQLASGLPDSILTRHATEPVYEAQCIGAQPISLK
jgi:hypothetical protein